MDTVEVSDLIRGDIRNQVILLSTRLLAFLFLFGCWVLGEFTTQVMGASLVSGPVYIQDDAF